VEQDHRNIKRRIRLMLGFKSFRRAQTILTGIEWFCRINGGKSANSAVVDYEEWNGQP
ncbi:DDE-type integrase/transposase/recombinase, partial [Enterobacter cloacae]